MTCNFAKFSVSVALFVLLASFADGKNVSCTNEKLINDFKRFATKASSTRRRRRRRRRRHRQVIHFHAKRSR